MNTHKDFHCYVDLTKDIIGGKWKPVILHHIGNSGIIRYGELRRKIPTINERVLSRQLRELERHHLIIRTVYKEKTLKVEYSMTTIGNELTPILNTLCDWGRRYDNFVQTELQCPKN